MGTIENLVHVLLVSFPGHGHVNPLLRLGKLLASNGFFVTFTTIQTFGSQMKKVNNNNNNNNNLLITDGPTPIGDGFIQFKFFEDGWDEDDPRRYDLDQYMTHLELVGKQVIPQMIKKCSEQDHRPVSCLINNPFIPWVSDVAESLGLPSAMLWVQSCACFAAYYHYHYGLVTFPNENETESNNAVVVHFPCMPPLKQDEVPSFLHPSTPYPFLRKAILGQFKNLEKPFFILMETFHELEQEIIDCMAKICPVLTVGPLFLKNPKPTSDDVCIDWLDGKPPSSVVYISFGTIVTLKQEQVQEFAYALLSSGVSFLWVMKDYNKTVELPDGFLEKVGDKGKVVQWSPQERVLAHASVACFVTHCGWNSTMESLASGVPVIAFPQWGDQVTDAVYLCDVFKTGLRLCRGEAENRIVSRDEVEKCLLEATVGPKAEEMKENALKWKISADKAVADGGSSDRNLRAFVDEVTRRSREIITISESKSVKEFTRLVEKK